MQCVLELALFIPSQGTNKKSEDGSIDGYDDCIHALGRIELQQKLCPRQGICNFRERF
jgi:hypothetical protein